MMMWPPIIQKMVGLFPVKRTPMAASLTFQCNKGELDLRLLFCSFGMLDFCHAAGEMFVLLDQKWDLFAVEYF